MPGAGRAHTGASPAPSHTRWRSVPHDCRRRCPNELVPSALAQNTARGPGSFQATARPVGDKPTQGGSLVAWHLTRSCRERLPEPTAAPEVELKTVLHGKRQPPGWGAGSFLGHVDRFSGGLTPTSRWTVGTTTEVQFQGTPQHVPTPGLSGCHHKAPAPTQRLRHMQCTGEGRSRSSAASPGAHCSGRCGSGAYRGCHFVPVCHKGTESFAKQGASRPEGEAGR